MSFDGMRGYLQLVTGLGEATRAKATEVAQGLLSMATRPNPTELAAQVASLAEDVMSAAESNRAALVRMIRREVEDFVESSTTLVKRSDLDSLTCKCREGFQDGFVLHRRDNDVRRCDPVGIVFVPHGSYCMGGAPEHREVVRFGPSRCEHHLSRLGVKEFGDLFAEQALFVEAVAKTFLGKGRVKPQGVEQVVAA